MVYDAKQISIKGAYSAHALSFRQFLQTWLKLVVGNDSCMCKAGFGGDDAPRAVFPSSCVCGENSRRAHYLYIHSLVART